MRRAALIAFVAGLAVAVVFEVVPWLDRERDFPAEIPNPPALTVLSLDVVPGGRTLCMRDIAADPHGREARFRVGTSHKPGPPLELTITAPGYRTSARQTAGFADNATLGLPIAAPPRQTLVTACITNQGKRKIAIYAANDRARSRAAVTIAGKRVTPTPQFGFWERKPTTIADRAGVTVDRMATFRGFFGHTWILWTLLALFCVGMSVGLAVVLWRGFAD